MLSAQGTMQHATCRMQDAPRAAVAALLCLPWLASAAPLAPAERPRPTRTQVGDGVYLFTTPGYGDVGLDGNSVAAGSTMKRPARWTIGLPPSRRNETTTC